MSPKAHEPRRLASLGGGRAEAERAPLTPRSVRGYVDSSAFVTIWANDLDAVPATLLASEDRSPSRRHAHRAKRKLPGDAPGGALGQVVVKHVLRYKQHDIELSEGKFVVGRAGSCQLSLDDPLVSRHHAELTVSGERVIVQDLGSRNGVKVNGALIHEPCTIKDKDHIMIGGQELIYLVRRENMGDTLVQPSTQRVPTFGLLGILADKAFTLGRAEEAERLLNDLLEQVLGDLEAGREVKPELFERATEYALRLAAATGGARWVEYIFRAYASIRRPCPAGIVDELYSVVRRVDRINLSALRTYIEVLRDSSATLGPAERFLVSRIEGLERLVAAK